MNQRRVLDIIEQEMRRRGLKVEPRGPMADALRQAALRIMSEAQTEQHAAARHASIVGASITRGRTRF